MRTDWSDKFLTSLAKKGNVTIAAKSARIARRTAYARREVDEEFRKAWADAIDEAADLLEEEARRRAQDGTLKPIYQGGEQVGTVREYSDTLLIFLLKGARPEKYKERRELTGPDDGPITLKILKGVSMDDL